MDVITVTNNTAIGEETSYPWKQHHAQMVGFLKYLIHVVSNLFFLLIHDGNQWRCMFAAISFLDHCVPVVILSISTGVLFFRHQNDESFFFQAKYCAMRNLLSMICLDIAASPNRRVAPTSSLMLLVSCLSTHGDSNTRGDEELGIAIANYLRM